MNYKHEIINFNYQLIIIFIIITVQNTRTVSQIIHEKDKTQS